ncbi:probable fanconi anemia group I protein homolog [Coccomyxa sp. Obi]|nr:probable fanconi anemia group I protein homolog [Coccomyxa sp. Obi]
MGIVSNLKQWCSDKPGLHALQSFLVRYEGQDGEAVVDQLFCSESRKELWSDIFQLLRSISQDPKTGESARSLRLAMVQEAVQHLSGSNVDDADELVALLQVNLYDITANEARNTIQKVLTAFESGAVCCLHLLPGLVNSIADAESGGARGAELVDCSVSKLVDEIIRVGWQPKETARLLGIARDISTLGKPEKLLFMRQALKAAAKGDVQEIPSVAHQVLLLCSQDHTAETLQGLMELIQAQERRCAGNEPLSRQLLQVAGTVLLDIEITVKLIVQGKAWMTNLVPQGPLTPFSIAVTLTLAAVPRLQQAARDVLKGSILGALHDTVHRQASSWVSALPRLPQTDAASIQAALIKAVENCALGWAIIVQPALDLVTELLDSAGKASGGFSASLLGCHIATAAAKAAHLGIDVVIGIFRCHAPARPEILNLCLARLIGAKEEQHLPYLRLLALLVREQPAQILNHVSCLRALVDLVPSLELNVALGLMLAIWPLCKEQRALKEQLIMCLRKAMFRPDVGARLLAVRGFLFMVLQELQAPCAMPSDDHGASSSQVSLSQCESLTAVGSGVSLLQDLTGFLRRSLTHQAPVREALYLGMLNIVSADPLVHSALVELLLPKMFEYFQPDHSLPAVSLEKCANLQKGEARLIEPLGMLLSAVRAAILAGSPGTKCVNVATSGTPASAHQGLQNLDAAQALQGIFREIGARLLDGNLENWGLDSSTNFSVGTPDGLLNHAMAGALLSSMEVYMEDIVAGAGQMDLDQAGEQLMCLFFLHHRLFQLAAVQGKKKGAAYQSQTKGKKRARYSQDLSPKSPAVVPLKDRQPILSASCLFRLLHMVCEDGCLGDSDEESETESLTNLARDASFQAFVLHGSMLHLYAHEAQLPLLGIIAGTGGADESQALHGLIGGNDWHLMGAQLLKTCQMIVLASNKSSGSKKKEHDPADGLPLLAVQSIAALLHLCLNKSKLHNVMASLPSAGASAVLSDDPALCEITARLHHLRQLLLRLVENGFYKEVEIFCGALGHVARIIPHGSTTVFSEWAEECLRQGDAEAMPPRTIKALVGLLLDTGGGVDLRRAWLVADTVILALDEPGPESQSLASSVLLVMNKAACSSAALALFQYVDGNLQDLERLLVSLKISQGSWSSVSQTEVEEAIFKRQHGIIELLSKLMNTASVVALGNSVSRTVVLTYRALTAAAKVHIVGKGKTRCTPCQAFQDMVTLVLKQLTPSVYDFVSTCTIQQQQPSELSQDGTTEAAASLKNEERMIPEIIFNLEVFEKHLIQITCYGHLNLMRHAKRSTNRDWRTVHRPSASTENQAGLANARV